MKVRQTYAIAKDEGKWVAVEIDAGDVSYAGVAQVTVEIPVEGCCALKDLVEQGRALALAAASALTDAAPSKAARPLRFTQGWNDLACGARVKIDDGEPVLVSDGYRSAWLGGYVRVDSDLIRAELEELFGGKIFCLDFDYSSDDGVERVAAVRFRPL